MAYKHAIVTPLNPVANAFRFRRFLLREITARYDSGEVASEKEIADCVVSGMKVPPTAEEGGEILRISAIMVYRPYAHVISRKSMSGYGMTTVLKSICDYERDCPTKDLNENTLWALSLAMGAMNTGRFERPWLNSQLHRAVLNHNLLPKLYHHVQNAATTIGPEVVRIEIPVYDNIHKIGGRIDLVLKDGTIIDIKCPIADSYPSNSWVQLALYANMANWNVPNIGVLDIAHGKLEYIPVDKEKLENLLNKGKEYLISKGFSNENDPGGIP